MTCLLDCDFEGLWVHYGTTSQPLSMDLYGVAVRAASQGNQVLFIPLHPEQCQFGTMPGLSVLTNEDLDTCIDDFEIEGVDLSCIVDAIEYQACEIVIIDGLERILADVNTKPWDVQGLVARRLQLLARTLKRQIVVSLHISSKGILPRGIEAIADKLTMSVPVTLTGVPT